MQLNMLRISCPIIASFVWFFLVSYNNGQRSHHTVSEILRHLELQLQENIPLIFFHGVFTKRAFAAYKIQVQ